MSKIDDSGPIGKTISVNRRSLGYLHENANEALCYPVVAAAETDAKGYWTIWFRV